MITKYQKLVFDYINLFTSEHGFAPTLEEIKEKFGFKSTSTAQYHVDKLHKAGYIEKDEHRSRSLKTKRIGFGSFFTNTTPTYLSLPVLGSANCGPANIFAVEDPREYVSVPSSVLSNKNKEGLFILEAKGDSMNNARVGSKRLSINDGDYVVIDSKQNNPSDGDYVLSVIDGCANIKKFKKMNDRFALISESKTSSYPAIVLSSGDNFMVNGKIISVLK